MLGVSPDLIFVFCYVSVHVWHTKKWNKNPHILSYIIQYKDNPIPFQFHIYSINMGDTQFPPEGLKGKLIAPHYIELGLIWTEEGKESRMDHPEPN